MATASESQPDSLTNLTASSGIGVMAAGGMRAAFLAFVELRADQMAQFGFDHTIVFVRVFHDFFGDFDVFLEGFVAGVNHHAGETFVDAFLAQFEGIAVVQVDRNGDGGQADGGLNEFLEINRVGVLARALGNLEHHRRLFLFARLDDGLKQFHVVDVERAQRVFAFQRLGKKFPGMCQWHTISLWFVVEFNSSFSNRRQA